MSSGDPRRTHLFGPDNSHANLDQEDKPGLGGSKSQPFSTSASGGTRFGATFGYLPTKNSTKPFDYSQDFSPLISPTAMPDFRETPLFHAFHRDRDGKETRQEGISVLESTKLANMAPPKIGAAHERKASDQTLAMDRILAQLTSQKLHSKDFTDAQEHANGPKTSPQADMDRGSSSNSLPITPANEAFPSTAPSTRPASAALNDGQTVPDDEVVRLKMQLAQAQSHITKLGQELSATRSVHYESDNEANSAPKIQGLAAHDSIWTAPAENLSDAIDGTSNPTFGSARSLWQRSKSPYCAGTSRYTTQDANSANYSGVGRGSNLGHGEIEGPYPPLDGFRFGRNSPEADHFFRGPPGSRRGPRVGNRAGAHAPFANGPVGYPAILPQFGSATGSSTPGAAGGSSVGQSIAPLVPAMYSPFSQQSVPTSLSPHASEFMSKGVSKTEPILDSPTYLPPTEPLNYRRLLDRNVNCNWKYIVDKIVCNNDQQASIFLQQKLKVGTPEQKYEIVEAIVAQAYPLMINRFGNFLVQRCFEHGTPEQVNKIAEAIRGNTLSLSMDPFGCHVVQKAFDSVPEEYKAVMVHELLRRIPETVIHRYACHVWQKLFELRWAESPPQIMQHVNQALRGMWHEVALGETGSLVVQNIFENCLEDDKRPCIEEVLANIDIVAHGQFGNWCIQHVCEHGAPPDRSRAIDHVIRYAAEYSTDQFASKVVEKCLKIGGTDFLGRYLDRVCEGRQDRTRIPLIDIASDQYGNYLIQWILNNSSAQHREMVAAHIRKHMVSLRGSKFGSRVGMLCTNHAITTRPGPGAGPGMGPGRMGPGPRYGAAPAFR